jgi:hypothetical protein
MPSPCKEAAKALRLQIIVMHLEHHRTEYV